MPSKTITISAAKWTRVKDAFVGHSPIPEKVDPAWVDTGDGTPPDMIPVCTEAEYPFYCLKKYVARLVRSYELKVDGKNNASAFDEDIMTIT